MACCIADGLPDNFDRHFDEHRIGDPLGADDRFDADAVARPRRQMPARAATGEQDKRQKNKVFHIHTKKAVTPKYWNYRY